MYQFRAAVIGCLALVAGCAAAEGPEESVPPTRKPAAQATPAVAAAPAPANFVAWRDRFRARALRAGITAPVFDAAFRGVGVNKRVLELAAFQPEFTKPIWEYLDSAVSETRIANGRRELAAKTSLMDQIEARYGVEKQYVLAVWGLESAYGYNYGNIRVVEALASLAYGGHRASWAEQQLVEALKILQNGDISPERMVGSWAGAMGHTQFIPTSFTAYAVDFTGDGRRDIWADGAEDALASTANYLKTFGWRTGQPWGVEARAPAGFNYALADQKIKRPVSHWRSQGLTAVDGSPLPDYGDASVVAPAGARGPVFVTFRNFQVIKRYNNATSYALAVGHLGDRILGAGAFRGQWPRSERALSRSEKVEIQQRLTALGFSTQGADGIFGPNTAAAVRAYQASQGLPQDGYAGSDLLKRLRGGA